MAKARHDQPPPSNRNTLIIMTAAGLLVAALVVWALTRTVEPASVMDTSTAVADAGTQPAPAAPAAAPSTTVGAFDATTSDTTAAPPSPPLSPETQTAASPAAEADRAEVKRIAVEDLHAQLNRGAVTVIDVRDAASFAQGHIPGSLNIPFASIESQLDEIPRDKPIVTYCS